MSKSDSWSEIDTQLIQIIKESGVYDNEESSITVFKNKNLFNKISERIKQPRHECEFRWKNILRQYVMIRTNCRLKETCVDDKYDCLRFLDKTLSDGEGDIQDNMDIACKRRKLDKCPCEESVTLQRNSKFDIQNCVNTSTNQKSFLNAYLDDLLPYVKIDAPKEHVEVVRLVSSTTECCKTSQPTFLVPNNKICQQMTEAVRVPLKTEDKSCSNNTDIKQSDERFQSINIDSSSCNKLLQMEKSLPIIRINQEPTILEDDNKFNNITKNKSNMQNTSNIIENLIPSIHVDRNYSSSKQHSAVWNSIDNELQESLQNQRCQIDNLKNTINYSTETLKSLLERKPRKSFPFKKVSETANCNNVSPTYSLNKEPKHKPKDHIISHQSDLKTKYIDQDNVSKSRCKSKNTDLTFTNSHRTISVDCEGIENKVNVFRNNNIVHGNNNKMQDLIELVQNSVIKNSVGLNDKTIGIQCQTVASDDSVKHL